MTTPGFRFLGDGRRRRLGDGRVRSVGAPVQRYTDIGGSVALGVGADGHSTAWVPLVGDSVLAFELSALLDSAGVIGHATVSFATSGALASTVNLAGVSVLGLASTGLLTAAVPIAGTSLLSLSAIGSMTNGVALAGLLQLAIAAGGDLSAATIIRGTTALGVQVSGTLTTAASGHWRDVWLDAYAGRQALLNAIDANNRFLAKEAGEAATANAAAIVQTNTRVEVVEGLIEAESERTTLLTTDVRDAEDAILAQGSALNNLSTRTTAAEDTLTSHGQAIAAVQNELPNKASAAALNSLATTVSSQGSQITTNSTAITAVQAQIEGKADASAVSAMSVNLNSLTNSYNASWTMSLNVNGKVAGLRSENNGTTSVIDFMFDSFRITGGAGSGWETTGGISRWYRSARQVIVGPGFGPNNLSFYIGPNVGIASASKANADIWFDDSGGYIRSGLITGAIVNARQSTQLGPTATVSTGNFASLGGSRIVNASLSYNTSYSILGNSPVSAAWTGTLQVRRGTTNVASVGFVITASSSYDVESNSTIVNIAGGGSLTYTDNTGGTTIEYNALIVGASGDWSALGSDPKWQSLAVSSLEQ